MLIANDAVFFIPRLVFIKSYDKGHSMAVLHNRVISGEDLMKHFISGHSKKNVFLRWVQGQVNLFIYFNIYSFIIILYYYFI